MSSASIGIQVSIQLWPFKISIYPTVHFSRGKTTEENIKELEDIMRKYVRK
jgi:galactose-1-phosphate uridylyltransferase